MNILTQQSNLSLSGSADVGFNYPISANEIISKSPFRSKFPFTIPFPACATDSIVVIKCL